MYMMALKELINFAKPSDEEIKILSKNWEIIRNETNILDAELNAIK